MKCLQKRRSLKDANKINLNHLRIIQNTVWENFQLIAKTSTKKEEKWCLSN